jgi:hypothetical protein
VGALSGVEETVAVPVLVGPEAVAAGRRREGEGGGVRTHEGVDADERSFARLTGPREDDDERPLRRGLGVDASLDARQKARALGLTAEAEHVPDARARRQRRGGGEERACQGRAQTASSATAAGSCGSGVRKTNA